MHQQLQPQEFLISLQPGTASESQEVTSREAHECLRPGHMQLSSCVLNGSRQSRTTPGAQVDWSVANASPSLRCWDLSSGHKKWIIQVPILASVVVSRAWGQCGYEPW